MSWFRERWPITPADWLRVADDLARAPTRAALEALEAVGAALAGKEIELRSAAGTITLHLDSVTGTHSDPPVALGAWRPSLDLEGFESVDVEARAVRWDGGGIDRLRVQATNVRVEGGIVAHLVAGPVGLSGEVDQATLDEWLERQEAGVRVRLDGDDRATVWVKRWLSARVSATLDGDTVTFPVRRVRFAGIPLPWAHRSVRPRRATVPELPRGLRLTSLGASPGVLRAAAVVDEFREPILLEQVLRAASTVGSHVVLNRVAPGDVA